jgi:uncharacterized membrane protein YhaH (DUF805 family)
MSYFDLLFSPKGTIKPQPFVIIVLAIYVINILGGSVLDGNGIKRVGPWPYLALQAALTWIWFAAHAKRLRDAGRGWTVAAVLAFIYIAAIVLMLNLVSATPAPTPADASEPKDVPVSLIGTIFAVLFINTLFTGDFFLISLLIFLFIGLPMLYALIVLIYSLVTAARASMTPEVPAVSPPPPPAQAPQSPFQ